MCGSTDSADLPIQPSDLPEQGRIWVAFSGGLDSTVLLHWLQTHARIQPIAVHVHHGLQAAADAWDSHCREFCKQRDIEYHLLTVDVEGIAEQGLEAAARQARYQALAGLLADGDVMLTAHHLDDQGETLLLQLLRGSGPHGLAAMPAVSRLGKGRLLRPLLSVSREQLSAYAGAHQLTWVEDPSNDDTRLRRNYIRQEVMPTLQHMWPNYRKSLFRSAALQAESAVLLDELASIDLEAVSGPDDSLVVSRLRAMHQARRRNLIRYWLRTQRLRVPNHAHMQRIETDMLAAGKAANPVVQWGNVELRRYRDALLAMSRLPAPPEALTLQWDLRQPLELPAGCGSLRAERAQGAGLRLETPRLEVRFKQTAESIRPVFSKHHKRLKHLFQENDVPPWVRERLPLIYHKHCLASVADRWIAAEHAVGQGEQGWRIHWCDAPKGWPAH